MQQNMAKQTIVRYRLPNLIHETNELLDEFSTNGTILFH